MVVYRSLLKATLVTFTLGLCTACAPKSDSSYRSLTPEETEMQKQDYFEGLSAFVPSEALAEGTEEERASWLKSFEILNQAQHTNYPHMLGDSDEAVLQAQEDSTDQTPEDFADDFLGLVAKKKSAPATAKKPVKPQAQPPKNAAKFPLLKLAIPKVQIPEIVDIPSAEDHRDLSPMKLLLNHLCKTDEHCLPLLKNVFAQAEGYYSYKELPDAKGKKKKIMGKLIHSDRLPFTGEGYHVKKDVRELSMNYSTAHAVRFVQILAAEAAKNKIAEKLIVGDISRLGGGPNSRHQSHQNGLDVDIGYLAAANATVPLETFPKDFIKKGRVEKKFGIVNNWLFLNMALQTDWVSFVIVHPAVKKAFCELAKQLEDFDKSQEILTRLVPMADHYDHFHFRLKCPISSPGCLFFEEKKVPANCSR